jgi:hypothetical protein
VNTQPRITLDGRDAQALFDALVRRRLGFTPEWTPQPGGPGAGLARIAARYLETIAQRLNQVPAKNRLAFLDTLGLGLIPAQAAETIVVFTLSAGAPDSQAPARSQLAAPPPPGDANQIVFETEQAVAVAAAALKSVVSVVPGRDEYVDHSAACAAATPFTLWDHEKRVATPHALYIAHDTLLALSGQVTLALEIELSQGSSTALSVRWEYWDGTDWRHFADTTGTGNSGYDSTGGLMRGGRVILESECAEAAKTSVNGANKYWIRGLLDEPLLPETKQLLPIIDGLKLSSIVSQPLRMAVTATADYALPEMQFRAAMVADLGPVVTVQVQNEASQPLAGVSLILRDQNGATVRQFTTNSEAEVVLDAQGLTALSADLSFAGLSTQTDPMAVDQIQNTTIQLRVSIQCLAPDKASSDGTAVDLTKPFFPFGLQPGPGSTFYFTSEECFSKPGAQLRVYFCRTQTAQDGVNVDTSAADRNVTLSPVVAWEYWNGTEWVALLQTTTETMDATGVLDFSVPIDMAPTKVNGQDGLWMRARIVSGTFGFQQKVSWSSANVTNYFTYVVVRPPALAAFGLGYEWQYGPFPAERVFTYNDFRYTDRTYEARWPGVTFPPYETLGDITPAVYLGFSSALPVDDIGIFLDVVENREITSAPAMTWEYWSTSQAWMPLSFEDETQNLLVPGILNFIGPDDSAPLDNFGSNLHWIRGRLKEDGPPDEPTVNRIYTNAVWAMERRTLTNAPLGASNGTASQTFLMTQVPVLSGELIEVRELAGLRADVEWRVLAMDVSGGDARLVTQLEALLAQEGPQTSVTSGKLTLTRDRTRKVTEAWVQWDARPDFYFSSATDRHYVLDRPRGIVYFGDGANGRIPPAGAQISAALYQAGGGSRGNVAAGAVSQILGSIGGVQGVTNPKPAEGGADLESLQEYPLRAPFTLRHRGRAVTPGDYETMAREASPAVSYARALGARNSAGRPMPGWVTLVIIPESDDPRPYPSFGLRREVFNYLAARAPADLTVMSRIFVTGPRYFSVDVSATVAPVDASQAGAVEKAVAAALALFLHPLHGGPDGSGWDFGRDVYLSDVAAVIEQADGVDYVEELGLLADGVPQGERLAIPDGYIAAAGTFRLKMKAAEQQRVLALSASRERT